MEKLAERYRGTCAASALYPVFRLIVGCVASVSTPSTSIPQNGLRYEQSEGCGDRGTSRGTE